MSSVENAHSPMSETPTLKGRLIAVAVGMVLLVVASEGILRVVMPHWREFFSGWFMRPVLVPDHGIVFTGRPGFDGYFADNNGDFRVRIRINDFGLRNPDPPTAAAGRVWFVGDSMTFGWGVEENEMYSSVAGRLAKVPTYDVASPGTDVCGYQALLARMPAAARPKAVIVGLVLENDIADYDCRKAAESDAAKLAAGGATGISDSNVKQFLMKRTALYNFLAVSLKRIELVRHALVAFGLIKQEHAYRPTLHGAETAKAVEKTAAELEAFAKMLPAGTPFAVLVIPARFEIRDGDLNYRRIREGTERALTRRGIAFIDVFEVFKRAGFGSTHFAHDGHWSPLGHELAGDAVASWLRSRKIGG